MKLSTSREPMDHHFNIQVVFWAEKVTLKQSAALPCSLIQEMVLEISIISRLLPMRKAHTLHGLLTASLD